jgi:hypothetical protein
MMDLCMLLIGTALVILACAFILMCGALMGPADVRPPSDEVRP